MERLPPGSIEANAVAPPQARDRTLSRKRHPEYALAAAAYMIGILVLSSMPDRGNGSDDLLSVIGAWGNQYPTLQHAGDLLHVPLYAGLAFLFLQAMTGGNTAKRSQWRPYVMTLVGTLAFAVLDEGFQFFVPGRSASAHDFLLNGLGIGGMLLCLRFAAARKMDP